MESMNLTCKHNYKQDISLHIQYNFYILFLFFLGRANNQSHSLDHIDVPIRNAVL